MADLPKAFFVHRVTVKTALGHDFSGELFSEEREVPAFVSATNRLIRSTNYAGTDQVVATATIRTSLEYADAFAPDSEVTLPDGRSGRVLEIAHNTDGAFGAWQHLKVVV